MGWLDSRDSRGQLKESSVTKKRKRVSAKVAARLGVRVSRRELDGDLPVGIWEETTKRFGTVSVRRWRES